MTWWLAGKQRSFRTLWFSKSSKHNFLTISPNVGPEELTGTPNRLTDSRWLNALTLDLFIYLEHFLIPLLGLEIRHKNTFYHLNLRHFSRSDINGYQIKQPSSCLMKTTIKQNKTAKGRTLTPGKIPCLHVEILLEL